MTDNRFTKMIRPSRDSITLTDADCDDLKLAAVITDERSELPVGTGFWPQFAFSHQAFDSFIDKEGIPRNRYNFLDDGEGVYPAHDLNSFLINGDGLFRLHEDGRLPVVTWHEDGKAKSGELAADQSRANENPILTALHRMACLLHNKRCKAYGLGEAAYFKAKADTIALLNWISINECSILTGLSTDDILNNVSIRNFHRSIEFNFQLARIPHAMMPDTVQGHSIFRKGGSISIDVMALFDGSENARMLNWGVSPAMENMINVRGEKNIINRTVARHNEFKLANWDDAARASKTRHEDIPLKNVVMWPGALMAAEKHGTGLLDPAAARLYADGVAGTLLAGRETNAGLWHERWNGAPTTTLDIIEYALS